MPKTSVSTAVPMASSTSQVGLEILNVAPENTNTEKDVCLPMLGDHGRANGIDFDEIDRFIARERLAPAPVLKSVAAAPFTALAYGAGPEARRNTARSLSRDILRKTSEALFRQGGKATGGGDEERNVGNGKNGEIGESGEIGKRAKIPKSARNLSISAPFFSSFSPRCPENPMAPDLAGAPHFATTGNGCENAPPHRFSFFHSDNEETVHSADLPSLLPSGTSAKDFFKSGNSTWWLDCTCPSDAEMLTLAKAFGIHPLTAEDIRMQEPREKVELFQDYYFICFQTFSSGHDCADRLEPINVYVVIFRDGVLTFHFSPVAHAANVRRRVRQLRDYVEVSADWIGYAIIDDITDGFAPAIASIEHDADEIESFVFDALAVNFASMLKTISQSRRRVMTLMRLLSNKADVVRMLAKRCQDETLVSSAASLADSTVDLDGLRTPFGLSASANGNHPGPLLPRADIAMYLGDIHDHIVTMFLNLSAYEKIFSRSHANYLTLLQVVSFKSNLNVTKILGSITMIGTMFFPLNVLTSLFAMNVNVPGQGADYWFWGIVVSMFVVVVASWILVKWYLRYVQRREAEYEESNKKSIKTFSGNIHQRDAAKSIVTFPNRYD